MDALGHAAYFGLHHIIRIRLDRRHEITSKSISLALNIMPSLPMPVLKPYFVVSDSFTGPIRKGLREFRSYKGPDYK